MVKKKTKKYPTVYAFIDSQNLNLSVANTCRHPKTHKIIYHGWKLDFAKFRRYLKDKYRVENAYLFIGYVHGNQKLYTYLQEVGYILIFKPTLEFKSGSKVIIKGNVDAELVLHTMIQYPNYQKAIIISGDGDYHCLIEHLRDHNKLGFVMIPNRYQFSSLLRKFRPYFIFISDLRFKLGKGQQKERE